MVTQEKVLLAAGIVKSSGEERKRQVKDTFFYDSRWGKLYGGKATIKVQIIDISVWFTPRASSCSTLSKPSSQSIVDIVSLSLFYMWPPITLPIATSLLLSHKTTLKSFSFYSVNSKHCLEGIFGMCAVAF